MSCSSFLIGQQYRSFGRICIVNLPTKKSVCLHVPFLPRFNEKINYCNIMRKTCYSDRCSPYVVSDWDLGDDLNCCRRTPFPGSVHFKRSIQHFCRGFPTFVLRWNTSIVSFRKFFSFIFSGSKERRTSGLLWFPSNLDCMNAISRAVRRYFRSSSWNLAQILFSGYH